MPFFIRRRKSLHRLADEFFIPTQNITVKSNMAVRKKSKIIELELVENAAEDKHDSDRPPQNFFTNRHMHILKLRERLEDRVIRSITLILIKRPPLPMLIEVAELMDDDGGRIKNLALGDAHVDAPFGV